MRVHVHFYARCRELAGCAETTAELTDGGTIAQLLERLWVRFPQMAAFDPSLLIAVGVDYQPRDCTLKDGDEVSLLPPVQGG